MEEFVEHIVTKDADGNPLTGDRNYRFCLPPNIPAKEFWSVIVYDNQTQLIINNGQPWPSVFQTSKKLLVNQDGSVDVWFGTRPPTGTENNWIKIIPGKEWTIKLRLYGILESGFEHTWRPRDLEVL